MSNLAGIVRSALGREQEMVRIRLRRQGSKGQPSYRIVVIDQRKARNGKYLENIGHYNPRTRPNTEVIKEDRVLYWLSVGAQPSDAVRRILHHTGTWERFRRYRNGESIEDLVREADSNPVELPDPRTKYPAPKDGESRLKAREADRVTDEDTRNGKEEQSKVTDETSRNQSDETEERGGGSVTDADETADSVDSAEKVGLQLDENKEETDTTDPKPIGLYRDLNRPGKTQLNDYFISPTPIPIPNHEIRRRRTQAELEESIAKEPDTSKRPRQVLTKRWEGKNPATREFLNQQYGGRCQICDYTFPKHDGEPYFEGLYIESFKQASWLDHPANVLCLCANHCAQFLYGSREFHPGFREQVLSYDCADHHVLRLKLIDKETEIRFSQRHIIDLKALVEITQDH